MLYDIILSELSASFYCYLVTCDCYTCDIDVTPTLTPVPRIEDKKNKVKRNLGPNFVSLTNYA